MDYERPELYKMEDAKEVILGSKPMGTFIDGGEYHTTNAYQADE